MAKIKCTPPSLALLGWAGCIKLITSFFAQRAKKALAEGQSPPQELEVSPRSGLYLLVHVEKRSLTGQGDQVDYRANTKVFQTDLKPNSFALPLIIIPVREPTMIYRD